jgi:hypothetical protein
LKTGRERRTEGRGADPSAAASRAAGAAGAAGAVAALLTGFYISELVYHVSPLHPFTLGVHTGILVPLVVIPMLIVNVAGLFWER